MSAERPIREVPEIIWPLHPTQSDVDEINQLIKVGCSPASSVSRVIIDEAKLLLGEREDYTTGSSDEKVARFFDAERTYVRRLSLTRAFLKPSIVILDTEQFIRGGASIHEELVAQHEGVKVRHYSVADVRSGLVVREAWEELIRQQYADILKNQGPLALVDSFTESRLTYHREFPREDLSMNAALIVACNAGRERFRQLYEVASLAS